jgi:hypothetical protein
LDARSTTVSLAQSSVARSHDKLNDGAGHAHVAEFVAGDHPRSSDDENEGRLLENAHECYGRLCRWRPVFIRAP